MQLLEKSYVSEDKEALDGVLSHPTTLRIFIYCLVKKTDVGVREVQKELNIKSTSTVSWHFTKLLDADYVTQLSNNRYELTELGNSIKTLDVVTSTSVHFYRGKFIPDNLFLLVFLVSSLIMIFIFYPLSLKFAFYLSAITLISVTLIIGNRYIKLLDQLEEIGI